MKNAITAYIDKRKVNKERSRRIIIALSILSLFVAADVFWQLRIEGITKTAEPYCGLVEHQHDESCGVSKVLICERTDHTHTEECYKTVYSCGLEEHTHTVSCFADLNADLESESDWIKTMPAELSGIRRNDLVSIAESQLGYAESTQNYILSEDGETLQHYSRYGEWYGNPYGNWNAMFASFCLYYAGIPQTEFPYAGGGATLASELQTQGLFELPDSYIPNIGDVVFLNLQPDGGEVYIGIISEITDTSITTIEGDVEGQVRQANYELSDSRINAYGRIESEDSQPLEDPEIIQEVPRIITKVGSDYTVTVSLTSEAAIPETAELLVRELERNSAEYDYYLQQTVSAMQLDKEPTFCRFFDVTFINDGAVIEPMAPVNVTITYAETLPLVEEEKCTAVHFADEGLELLETQVETTDEGDAVTFTQDSFSIVGTVIEGVVSLTNGNRYVFYTGDGYALGVTYNTLTSSYEVKSVAIKIANNGYITPKDTSLNIDNISWTFNSNYGLYNTLANRYLNFTASSPQVVQGTSDYVSTLGLMTGTASLTSSVINSSVKLMTGYYSSYTGNIKFLLAYEDGVFKSGTAFNSAQTYLLTADVVNVSDELVEPGNLEVTDDIRLSGTIKPKLNVTIPGTTSESTYTYAWEKSVDDGLTWNKVVRKKITGNFCNVAEDGSWLNVALDQGAEAQYRVSLVAVDGVMLGTPIRSQAYHVPYFDELKNGDFEEPVVPLTTNAGDYQPLLSNGTSGMIWKTTASDGQIEYISVAQPIYQEFSQKWHACEAASNGVQYVELNATEEGALYQDVLTVPGSTLYWQLFHRARGTSYLSGQFDTMYVVIMSTKMAEDNDITTNIKVQDVIDHPSNYPGASVVTVRNNNMQWHKENGSYTVPEEQYLSRYFFVAGHTASNDTSVGNHLDNVSFSTELPPPDPDKTNVMVVKTIAGLSYDDAYELLSHMEFSIYDVANAMTIRQIGSNEFGLLNDNGDGTYSVRYTEQGLTPGRYIVYENTNNGIADKFSYARTTTVTPVHGHGESRYENGYYLQEVDAPGMGTASVTFLNSYVRETASVTLMKTGSDGGHLSAEFELAARENGVWTRVGALIETTNGQAVMSGLSYDTLYRLTETKAPDGYIGRPTPMYFKYTVDGIVFYDETGITEVAPPDDVTAGNVPLIGMAITVVNRAGFALPNTGGVGTLIFTITGLLLITCSIIIGFVLRRKHERRLIH